MKRRFNYRLFLALAGGFALFAVGVHFLHAVQVKRTAGLLIRQADAALEKKDHEKAIGFFGRYLALVPGDPEAMAKYGLELANDKIATSPRALQRAYFVLDRALFLNNQRQDVRRRLIEVAMHPWMYRIVDAAEHIDWFKEAGVIDAELLGWRGQCYSSVREFGEARKCFEKAIGEPTKREDDFVRLAYLLREEPIKAKNNTEKSSEEVIQAADQKIEEMLAAFPGSFRARLMSSRYYRQYPSSLGPEKTRQRIIQDIEKAVILAPTEAEVLLAAAELELERHQTGAARAYLNEGIKLHADDWRMYQVLARVEMEAKDPVKAVEALTLGLLKLPKQKDLMWNLAHLYLRQEENDEAEKLITRLAKDGFRQRELDYLQARLLVNKEQWSKAARLLERTYPQFLGRVDQTKDWFAFGLAQECNFLSARCFEQMGDPDRAGAAYGLILSRDPNSIPGRLGLARTEWTIERLDMALRAYRELLQAPQVPPIAWIECGQLLLFRNLKTANPNWAELQQFLNQAAKLDPIPVEIAILRAEVLAAQKQYDSARELLGKTYEKIEERPVEVWIGLADIEQRDGKHADALAILNEAKGQVGDHIALRIALVRYWSGQGRKQKDAPAKENAQDALKAALAALAELSQGGDTWPAADQRRLAEELATAYQRLGESKLAEAQWRKIAEKSVTDVGSRLVLFDLAFVADDEPGMGKLADELKAIEGDEGTLWRFCEARRLIWRAMKHGEKLALSEASKHLAVVAGRRANWSRVPMAQGHINELLGNYDAAIAKYREAIALGGQDPAVIGRLALLLSSQGRYSQADEMLAKLKELTGGFGDLSKLAAERALATRDAASALSLARKAVSAKSKDFRDHMWLGQILWSLDKTQDAEEALLEAFKLAPANPEPTVALVQFYRTENPKKAEMKVREFEVNDKVPKEQRLLPLAFCQELLGWFDDAKNNYRAALEAKPNDVPILQAVALFHIRQKDPKEAQKYLDKIISLMGGSDQEKADAKRVLALVLSSSGNYQDTQKALGYLGLLDDSTRPADLGKDASMADKRAKIIVLARQPNPKDRRKAIAMLEEMAAFQPLSNDEQFLLAQLYESVGEWPKARAQFVLLLNKAQTELTKTAQNKESASATLSNYLAAFCGNLLKHGAVNDAESWWAKLKQMEPQSFRTLAIEARLRFKQGRAAEVVKPLIDLAGQKAELVQPIARLLEEIDKKDEAKEMYERFVTQSQAKTPENVLVLATFLARWNKIKEALDVCEAAWKNCKPEAVADASVFVLYTAKSGKEHWDRVSEWLERECDKKPGSTVLLRDLAAVSRLQKNYQSVITSCRRILELDKTDAITMNNLAWMLALHDKKAGEALQFIQKAIALEGPTPGNLDTRSVIWIKLGKENANQAIKDLENAIAELPNPHYYFHLAQAHLLVNNESAAVSAFHQAKRLGLDENSIDPLEKTDFDKLTKRLKSQ